LKIAVPILTLLLVSMIFTTVGSVSAADPFQPAGYQSYYVLGDTSMVVQEVFDEALNLDPGTSQPYGVFSLASSQNASMVYIDQKHNGYTFNPETFTGADAVFILDKGAVLTMDNWASPYWSISPGSMGHLVSGSLGPVDGGDYVFTVGGPVNVVRGITDRQSGTGTDGSYVAEMTEVYPVEEGGESGGLFFILPVGEDTSITPDFNGTMEDGTSRGGTYAIVQSYNDGTTISYSLQGVAQPPVTLDRGESMVIAHTHQNDTISSSKKIQVVLFGSGGLVYDTRFFNIPDTRKSGNDYWVPTFPTNTNSNITVRFHIFALTDTHLTVASVMGTAPAWDGRLIPALTSEVTFITAGMAPLHIYGREGERFIVLVSVDSGNSAYDWGYVPKDSSNFVNSYFIPYAPGGLGHYYDMQLFVLPLYDGTTIYVDYDQDGTADDEQTLNRFQAYGFYNPSGFGFTGTHIYSDFPFTVVYGESPLANSGGDLPGFDWGYTILPFDYVNYDSALSIGATVDMPVVNPNGTITFTMTIDSSGYTVHNIDAFDQLPAGFSYVAGSSNVTYPNGATVAWEPAVSDGLLHWDLNTIMQGNSTLAITFKAEASPSVGSFENIAYATASDPWDNLLRPETRLSLTVSGESLIFGRVTKAAGGALPGVQVSLFDGAGTFVTEAVTDGNGMYKFINLTAGSYRVSYDLSDPDLTGYWPLSDSDPLLPSENPLTSSAAFLLPEASSHVHNFVLSQAIVLMEKQSSPDPADRITEVTFTIRYWVPEDAPATTGNVLVDELEAFLVYKVGSLALNGSALTDALDSDPGDYGASNPGAVTVSLGNLNPGDSGTVTFTALISHAFPGSTVNNTAFIINERDGAVASASSLSGVSGPPAITEYVNITGAVLNVGYPLPAGIGSLTVCLFNSTGIFREALTTASGNFSFDYLPPGVYTINYPTGHPQASPFLPISDSDGGLPYEGTVNATVPYTTYTHDFNLTMYPSVSGVVFVDWDMDGTLSEGDSRVPNATVLLYAGYGFLANATLDDGSYSFAHLMPGEYAVAVDPADLYPYRPNSDSDSGLAYQGNLTLVPGTAESHSFALILRLPAMSINKTLIADGDDCITGTGIVCGNMVFNVTITNTGNATLSQVSLVDSYNATAFAFTSANPAPGSVNNATGTLSWGDLTNGTALAPGASATVLVYMKSVTEYPANTTMNTATASAYDQGHTVSAFASAQSGPLQGRVCGSIDPIYIALAVAIIAMLLLLILILLRRRKRKEEA